MAKLKQPLFRHRMIARCRRGITPDDIRLELIGPNGLRIQLGLDLLPIRPLTQILQHKPQPIIRKIKRTNRLTCGSTECLLNILDILLDGHLSVIPF